MKIKLAFCLLLLLLPRVYCQDATQQKIYIITENEISSIEKFKATYETEKQNWLLQVKNLNTQVTTLREQSKALQAQVANLNSLLETQRATNKELEMCYNELEQEKFQEISQLNSEKNTLTQSLHKAKNRFYFALCAGIIEAVLLAVFLFLKIRKLF